MIPMKMMTTMIKEKMMNEMYAALELRYYMTGALYTRVIDPTEGKPASVEFNWNYAWDLAGQNNLIGFYHDHPFSRNPQPSETDLTTMRGWVVATGLDIVCIIGNGRGKYNAWVFYGEETQVVQGNMTVVKHKPIKVKATGGNILNRLFGQRWFPKGFIIPNRED